MPHAPARSTRRRAWLTVVASFLASAVTLGTAYSFGAFFESMSEEFGSASGETAVIFGITTFSFFWLSLVTGRMMDRFGPRSGAAGRSGGDVRRA